MLALGTRVGLEEEPDGVNAPTVVSTSPMVKRMEPVDASSLSERSARSLRVGTSLTELTVTTKESLVVATPSLTVTVMVALPNWLVAGRTVTVREPLLTPKEILPLGMSVGLEEAPARVREPAAL